MLMILLGRYLSGPGHLSKQDPRPHVEARGRGANREIPYRRRTDSAENRC
jgi:hypothetical protein